MEDIRLGFTGTQNGMTEDQYMRVAALVTKLKPRIKFATHGDCIGADEEFHEILWTRKVPTIIRPCTIENKRANCRREQGRYVMFEAMPEDPMMRNTEIVRSSNLLIATPKGMKMEQRSGTWATIRRAKSDGIAHVIIWPDGTWEKFGPTEEGARLPEAKVDALEAMLHSGDAPSARMSAQTTERTDVTDYTIKNPDEEASGKQLYVLNKHGMLSINAKKGKTITKGEASPAISKAFGKTA